MKMNKNALIVVILGLLFLFSGSLAVSGYAYDYSNYRPAYISGAGNYVAGYGNGNYGYSPYLMTSMSYSTFYGYKQNYVSHIYVRNALDYTYYTHPELLATRYMDNRQRYYHGAAPQWFSY